MGVLFFLVALVCGVGGNMTMDEARLYMQNFQNKQNKSSASALNSYVKPLQSYEQPQAQQSRDVISSYLSSTPQQFTGANKAFEVATPEVEAAAQKKIIEQLNTGYDTSQLKQMNENAYQVQKDRLKQSFDKMSADTADRYNRLGLVSSTPGLQAQDEVSNNQMLAERELSSQLEQADYNRRLDAEKLAQNIIDKAMQLGQTQRQSLQTTLDMSYNDFLRKEQYSADKAKQAQQYLNYGGLKPGEAYSYDYNQYLADLENKKKAPTYIFKGVSQGAYQPGGIMNPYKY